MSETESGQEVPQTTPTQESDNYLNRLNKQLNWNRTLNVVAAINLGGAGTKLAEGQYKEAALLGAISAGVFVGGELQKRGIVRNVRDELSKLRTLKQQDSSPKIETD